MSETTSAVDRPGWNTKAATSSGGRSSARSESTMPASTARARRASRSMPPPSSLTVMWIRSFSRRASTTMRPISGLPAASRTSGASMPWSTALRKRCTSGSLSRSRIERSSSISALWIATSTRFPTRWAISRAIRGSGSTMRCSGVVRSSRARHCRSATARSMRSSPTATLGGAPAPSVWLAGAELTGAQDHLAHGPEEAVEGLGVDAQRRRRRGDFGRLGGR